MNGFTAMLLFMFCIAFGVQNTLAQDSTDTHNRFSIGETERKSPPDLLQFAPLPEGADIQAPPFGFGVGASTYTPDVSGLQSAYDAIANKLSSQGYSVAKRKPDLPDSPLLSFNLWFRLSSRIALSLETALSMKTTEFRSVSISGLYRFISSEQQLVKPYAGLGIGHYYLKMETKYGDRVGPDTYLQNITTTGGSFGTRVGAGCEFSNNTIGGSVQMDYIYVPELATSHDAGGYPLPDATMDLSSYTYSARIIFYF